jgi:hypothetical protein
VACDIRPKYELSHHAESAGELKIRRRTEIRVPILYLAVALSWARWDQLDLFFSKGSMLGLSMVQIGRMFLRRFVASVVTPSSSSIFWNWYVVAMLA